MPHMTLHLIKLAVGVDSIADLEAWQAQRLASAKRDNRPAELEHITRHMPKRADELLNGGSLYWVIKGFISARQPLVALRAVTRGDTPHCALVYAPELVRVQTRPHRPFQGWRYLSAENAPPDIAAGDENMPEDMRRELAALGLL